jgi:hypothetical protein
MNHPLHMPRREKYLSWSTTSKNLFDLDGFSKFDEYSQVEGENPFPYSPQMLMTKVTNIAKAIAAMDEGMGPDIVALQELEIDFTNDPNFDLFASLERFKEVSLEIMLLEEFDDTIAGLPAQFF